MAIVRAGIPVQGHIGLTPQRIAELGGFKVQGKTREAAQKLIDSAQALEKAGCFSIVLEAIPAPVAAEITQSVSIPTIGIGAGPHCDGQVLVYHDILGMFERFVPKFVKQYAKLSEPIVEALRTYCDEVRDGSFPDAAPIRLKCRAKSSCCHSRKRVCVFRKQQKENICKKIRVETDSIGPVEVPEEAYWGAQTQRSLHHFSIGSDLIPHEVIKALAIIKKAASPDQHFAGQTSRRVEGSDLPGGR